MRTKEEVIQEMGQVERRCELLNRWFPWLEYQADREAETRLRAVTFSEFMNAPQPPEFVQRHAEERYRRGYWHGYSQAMDDLERASGRKRHSKAWLRLARFFDGALSRWRYADHGGRIDMPPSFRDDA